VREPEECHWSSFLYYAFRERGAVLVNEHRPALLRIKGRAVLQTDILKVSRVSYPTRRKKRDEWGTQVSVVYIPRHGWATRVTPVFINYRVKNGTPPSTVPDCLVHPTNNRPSEVKTVAALP
jgi:hypothetical protein